MYELDGIALSSVTQVIEDSIPFNAYGRDIKAAARFGNILHETIHLYDMGELKKHDPVLDPWIEAWKKFLADHPHLKLIHSEHRMADAWLGYAGTADKIYEDTKRKRFVYVDLKSGAYSPKWGLQIAAYEELYLHEISLKSRLNQSIAVNSQRIAVKLEEGDYKPYEFKGGHLKYFNIFRSMLNVYNWKKEYKL